MKFVGLGTQNIEEDARDFVVRHDITFPIFWDEGFASWQGFGIQRQPAAVLVAPDGRELGRWQGELTPDRQAEAARLAQEA